MSTKSPQRSSPWRFFALTFGFTLLFLIPAALSGQHATTPIVVLLRALGGVCPALVAIGLTLFTQDREDWRDFWRRLIEFKRIGPGWYAVILLIVPVLTIFAVLLDVVTGGSVPQFEALSAYLSRPLTIVPFAIYTLIFGPLPEELGWRGYALDRLQAKQGALVSSLILGTAWSLWHLPLFFIEGTYQNALGLGSLPFWLFLIDLIPKSILFTWIYNNTQRSTLSAVLLHFMINFTGELVPLSDQAELYRVVLYFAAAAAVTAIWGSEALNRLNRREKQT